MRKFTAAEREEIRREDAKKAKVSKVRCSFVVNEKPWVEGILWTENPSLAGFRTYAVGHPEYWQRLQEGGAVPRDLEYDGVPRGRVKYEYVGCKFTIFADR